MWQRHKQKQVEHSRTQNTEQVMATVPVDTTCGVYNENIQERPAVADKPARRFRNVCTVYVRAVGL